MHHQTKHVLNMGRVIVVVLCALLSQSLAHAQDTPPNSSIASEETTCGAGEGSCGSNGDNGSTNSKGIAPRSGVGNPINLMNGNIDACPCSLELGLHDYVIPPARV